MKMIGIGRYNYFRQIYCPTNQKRYEIDKDEKKIVCPCCGATEKGEGASGHVIEYYVEERW